MTHCDKRIVLIPDHVETYCNLPEGHKGECKPAKHIAKRYKRLESQAMGDD